MIGLRSKALERKLQSRRSIHRARWESSFPDTLSENNPWMVDGNNVFSSKYSLLWIKTHSIQSCLYFFLEVWSRDALEDDLFINLHEQQGITVLHTILKEYCSNHVCHYYCWQFLHLIFLRHKYIGSLALFCMVIFTFKLIEGFES